MPDITRAIAALTYDEIEQHAHDWRGETVLVGEQVPLLHRSIANDLVMMAKQPELFSPKLLMAIAASIDDALLALVEEV